MARARGSVHAHVSPHCVHALTHNGVECTSAHALALSCRDKSRLQRHSWRDGRKESKDKGGTGKRQEETLAFT